MVARIDNDGIYQTARVIQWLGGERAGEFCNFRSKLTILHIFS